MRLVIRVAITIKDDNKIKNEQKRKKELRKKNCNDVIPFLKRVLLHKI